MRIAVLGAGYVGLVSGACFAEFGVNVTIVDTDPAKVEALRRGIIPIYEPGLERLVTENHADGRLAFTTDLDEAMQGADCVFLAVGTPSRRGDGHADLQYVYAAAEGVARAAKKDGLVLVTKSTVPVGTGRKIQEIVRRVRPDLTIHVASNPEFLREGNAITDFMRPDRVVLGADDEAAFATLRRLYRPLYLIETPIVAASLETAELIKYSANAFLATKITFINEIADLCEKVGADVHDVARGMGLDGRIGRKFLHPGPGYGGSCFPKDTLALAMTARDAGSPMKLVETTIAVNEARKEAMAERVIAALGGDVRGKAIGVLGVTFKPETDDMRDAPSLVILPRLLAAGARITAHDPQLGQARQMLPAEIAFAASPLEAIQGADAVVLLTEWNEYRSMAPEKLRQAMQGDAVLDLRNAWDPEAMREAGLRYFGVGRR
ncbi:UDP-glucose dehydrogenase family protein [Paeniroseomonas aquatica]|uniref:UDP-glucose 6-dehydrogenase n=1 Tax=Paeniroseomonas aquatica TaxID=373043 RepID=A0ABT7ZZC9_9PROT|nr:UDP-glucose/GDP-mannose dehydrogenase family protein [Paeniroseomonas aquatica]MDN3562821.1 UDP-glucose/GDP-mannose dehydrogenase family protein [Paeniroseomonas aquatica]